MPERKPAEKLLLKPGMTAALLHVPDGLLPRLAVPPDVRMLEQPRGADFILDFAYTQAEAEQRLGELEPAVTPKTVAWIAYPKGSKASGFDLNRDSVARHARTVGLVVVSNVSIDDVWSALRVRPVG